MSFFYYDVFDLLAYPQSSIPYGFDCNLVYKWFVFKVFQRFESSDFLPINHSTHSLIHRSICCLFFFMCSLQPSLESKWRPKIWLFEPGISIRLRLTMRHFSLLWVNVMWNDSDLLTLTFPLFKDQLLSPFPPILFSCSWRSYKAIAQLFKDKHKKHKTSAGDKQF